MADSQKVFYKTNEFKTALTILFITGIGTIAYDSYKDQNLFTTVNKVFSILKDYTLAFLIYKVSLFWILLILTLSVTIVRFVIKFKKDELIHQAAPYEAYITDRLKKWRWSWRYNTYNNKISITDLRPHCPNCDTTMHYDLRHAESKCPRCEKHYYGNTSEDMADIEALIIDNINRRNLLNT